MRLQLTPDALEDFAAIRDHFLDQGSHVSAHVREAFDRAFSRLAARPSLGHRREDLAPAPYLVYRVFRYLIFYRVERNIVFVIRILHAARDIPAILDLEHPTAQ